MEINNIGQGEIFKNYKHLCEVLGEKVEAGNSKKSQLKEWGRHFSYEKQGNKFIITEIYNEPKDKIENRGGARTILAHDNMMKYKILQEIDKSMVLQVTINGLMDRINMINDNFNYCSWGITQAKVSKYMDLKQDYVQDFFVNSKSTIKQNLKSRIDKLESEGYINVKVLEMVCYINTEAKINSFGDIILKAESKDDEIKYVAEVETSKIHREASPEESFLIADAKNTALEELNCSDISEVFDKQKYMVYKGIVNRYLLNNANIAYAYDSYRLTRTDKPYDDIKQLAESEGISVNQGVRKQLLTNAQNRHKKAINNNKKDIRTSDTYLESMNKCIDMFVDLKQEDITEEVKAIKL